MSEQRNSVFAVNAESSVPEQDEMTIDLMDIIYKLMDNWKRIFCVGLVFTLLSGIYTFFFVTPLYEATSTIYVLSRRDSAINMSDLQLGTALTSDYIKIFKLWEVHEQVISNLNLPYTYSQMKDMLSVNNESGTRMLDISIRSANPVEAANIANEYAKVVSQYIAETMSTDKPNIMSVALVPNSPITPNKTRNMLMAFILGIFMSAGVVVVKTVMDDKYKTTEDIRKYTGLITLAVVPVADLTNVQKGGRRRV